MIAGRPMQYSSSGQTVESARADTVSFQESRTAARSAASRLRRNRRAALRLARTTSLVRGPAGPAVVSPRFPADREVRSYGDGRDLNGW